MKIIRKYLVSTVAMLLLTCLFIGIRAEAAAPGPVTGVKQTEAETNGFTVEWDHLGLVEGVRYKVSAATTKTGTYTELKSEISQNKYTTYGKNPGTSYWVKVRAYVVENGVPEYGIESAPVEAITAPANPTGLKQIGVEKASITLKWNSVSGASGYLILYAPTDNSVVAKEVASTANSIKINQLKADKEYNFLVRAYRTGEAVSVFSKYTYLSNVPTIPGKVSGLKCTRYLDSGLANFSFNGKSTADGYQLQVYEKNGRTKVKDATGNYNASSISISNAKLRKNRVYSAKIRAFITVNGAKKYGDWSNLIYFAKQPTLKNSYKSTSSGIKISWTKLTGATSYSVYVSTKKNTNYKLVGTTNKASITIKKYGKSSLKSRQAYYVKVITNTKVKGKTYKSPEVYYWGPCYK